MSIWDDEAGYEYSDPKHPTFHDRYAGLWDNRDKSLKPVCGFCKGGPVGNAASWLDGKPRPPAPCPRCGEVYQGHE